MSPIRGRQVIRVLLTLTVGSALVLLYWYSASPPPKSEATSPKPSEDSGTLQRSPAMRYAHALQESDCDAVIGMTWWMNERLRNAAIDDRKGGVDQVRSELCEEIQDRAIEGNRLRPEGVEDRYLFAPGVDLEALYRDRGRDDLEQPVDHRLWVQVTYPTPSKALCDEHGRPIRSIRVGVNVSREGYVLKASFIGNLDLNRGSISYDWEPSEGG